MTSREIVEYFDSTSSRDTRADLKLAVKLLDGPKVAIDCGCGAGSDIAYLLSNGFVVYAFDIESESISRCKKRFANDNNIRLVQATFSSFHYPNASLIVAEASLFFCPENEFTAVWNKITTSLRPKGIFVGSFLGSEDTMASLGYKRDNFWPEVLVVTEKQIRDWLNGFKIISFTEHKTTGKSINSARHQWHIFSVVAQKEDPLEN